LIGELDRAGESMQVLLIAALVDRQEKAAVPALEKRAGDAVPAVRVAALRGLGIVARPASLDVLLRALAESSDTATRESAAGSLARIPLVETDAFLLAALPRLAPETAVHVIRILGERGTTPATFLFKLARDSDPRISQAAFRALQLLATPAELPALIELSLGVSDEATRTLADVAIVTTTMKLIEPAHRADAVLAAWRATDDTDIRRRLLRPLGAIVRSMGGSEEALAVVRAALNANDDALRSEAEATLANWPVPAKTKAGKNAPRR
jgi:HEAT repeat protein